MTASLSKSLLLAAAQCPKRLWLEVHRPSLARTTPAAETAFRSGHRVGEAARAIYARRAGGIGHTVPYDEGLREALRSTARLLTVADRAPIFEATAEHDGVVVRADVLLPEEAAWRLVEVKGATAPGGTHALDCAIQAWVLAGAGIALTGTALAHVDTGFVYAGGDDYTGLLAEHDLSAAVRDLLPEIPARIGAARSILWDAEPAIGVGRHCFQPWTCPFTAHCWPSDAAFPVQDLGGSKALLGALVAEGFRDLRDVPEDRLTPKQRRIRRVSRLGRAELSADAAAAMAAIPFPRYYLDFETVAPAVPRWAGTRPYEIVPFQWSCHYEAAAGELDHADYLDLSGGPPMRRLAESLIRALGRHGPVLTYTAYERRVIDGLARQVPELAPALGALADRLVDLKPLAARHYYHPRMHGSWSLKAVLVSLAPDSAYDQLEGIQSGTDASEAWFEATDPGTTPARRAEIARRLKQYCRLDTEALVRLARHLARAGRGPG